jgi:hypothetical protein
MRFLTIASLLCLFLGLFHLTLAADSNVEGELEEDAKFWSRTLTMSMSMPTLGDESYASASGGSCGHHCTNNKDCQKGGYNPCYMCGQYVGAQYYHQCYDPNQYSPTPAPTHNYFPDGGSCSMKCKKNADCRKGGYNPCGMCGQYVGTIMYRRCYSPEY